MPLCIDGITDVNRDSAHSGEGDDDGGGQHGYGATPIAMQSGEKWQYWLSHSTLSVDCAVNVQPGAKL